MGYADHFAFSIDVFNPFINGCPDNFIEFIMKKLVKNKNADVVQESREEKVLRFGRLQVIGDCACSKCAGECVQPEFFPVEERSVLPAFEHLHHRNSGHQIFNGVEPEKHDCMLDGSDLSAHSVKC